MRWKFFKTVTAKDRRSACYQNVEEITGVNHKGTEEDPFTGTYIECYAIEQREPTMVFNPNYEYYVIEVRDKDGNLDFKKEEQLRDKYPGVFLLGVKNHGKGVTCDQIVGYVAQRTDWEYASPQAAYDWMTEQGFTIRVKTW